MGKEPREHQATAGEARDPQTGLERYSAMMAALDARMTAAEGREVTLAVVDLDWFDRLNKEHGTEAGDAILRLVAGLLTQTIGSAGEAFRCGGDAFGVVLPGMEKEAAFLLMEEVRRACARDHALEGAGGDPVVIPLALTIGVASYPEDAAGAQELFRKASEALYRGKAGGRNRVCLAREERMVTKTSHYTQSQLHGLARVAKREGLGEAALLREALDDLLRKYSA